MSNQVARNSYERYAGTPDDRYGLSGNQSLPYAGTDTNNIVWDVGTVTNLSPKYYEIDEDGFINIYIGGLYSINVSLQIAQVSGQDSFVSTWIYIQHGDQPGESAATMLQLLPLSATATVQYCFSYLASVNAGDILAVRALNRDAVYSPAVDDVATELRISKVL